MLHLRTPDLFNGMAHPQLTPSAWGNPTNYSPNETRRPQVTNRLSQFHQQVSTFIDSNVIGAVVVSHLCG
jgi:hypothetical protein